MSIIIVHELGHLTAAKIFKWKTDKIYIYPLGGITKFNESINRSLKEELIIVLMGPIFQIIYYNFLTYMNIENIAEFNFILLGFNLLPIYPLDGGKLLNVILSYFLPYKFSYKITMVISYTVYILMLFTFILFSKSFFFTLISFFLIFKVIEEYERRNYYYNKFLLERYLNEFKFSKIKYINRIDKMQRDRIHFFKCKGTVITEKKMLQNYFKNNI